MKLKLLPSGHSSVYTFVLAFRDQAECLRAKKVLEGKISTAPLFGSGGTEIKKTLEELKWAQRAMEGNKIYIYSEFQTDFEVGMFQNFLKWIGLHPKLDIHYSDYPLQTITFLYPVPVGSTRGTDLVKVLPLLLPEGDWRIIHALLGKLVKVDDDGLTFSLTGTCCYNSSENRVYPEYGIRVGSFDLVKPWKLLSLRHRMEYPPRTE